MMLDQSEKMKAYMNEIDNGVKKAYNICSEARKKGFDPEEEVGIPLANNMAERVEALVSVAELKIRNSGLSQRIHELEEIHGKLSWKVALIISLETAQEKFCIFQNKLKAMETGIRVGLAYLTLGVVASPLEGFVELKLKHRFSDNKAYFCLFYSGPIRSAGGTAAAVSVLVADYIRKKMGYAEYDPTEEEIKRSVTELYDYHERIANLQYLPSEEEIKFLIRHLPVQIDGDASETIEVSNYKDLRRIETNIIRNGFCLVIAECISQKAMKLWKQLSAWGDEFDLKHWAFIGDFVKLQKQKKAKKEEKIETKIQPDYTYMKDLVAGRPILGFPLRNGGFRLRYGRCRNSGYSSAAIHPATMYILDKYIAIGTQLKLERPGKATSLSTCDSIEGPLLKLNDGTVLRVNDVSTAKNIASQVSEIIYLGDILINYGDFFNRAHALVPTGYCEEWWLKEFKKRTSESYNSHKEISSIVKISEERLLLISKEMCSSSITGIEALSLSECLKIPLHPKYTYYWNSVSFEDLCSLFEWLSNSNIIMDTDKVEKVVITYNKDKKRVLELLGVPHKTMGSEYIIVSSDDAVVLSRFIYSFNKQKQYFSLQQNETNADIISRISGINQRDRNGTFIGARMGRPEKAKVRKLQGQPHCLFPVGDEGGRLRSFQSALEAGKIISDFPIHLCKCGNETIFSVCEKCNSKTERKYYCQFCGVMEKEFCSKHGPNSPYKNRAINITELFKNVMQQIQLDIYPDLIKGVKGTSNKQHIPEHLAKGILRAKYNIPVNKDGTTRYDMTQLAVTHLKPKEIGTTIEKLKELGYEKDIFGNQITNEEQVIEIFPQDLILPACQVSGEKGSDEVLHNLALFIDELLMRLYKLQPFYNLKSSSDLVGHFVLALAPHTSAGIIGRIIGFSKTQGFYAHPMFHAATRRDCDGDEACVTLLLDALLNFSRHYLPDSRGATQDAPLILTSKLIPSEVDDMVFDVDVAWEYPLEYYEAALQYKKPWEIKIDQIGNRLNTERQYEGMGFTHDTTNINAGVLCSAYKLLPTMEEKLHGQMNLAIKIRAVDEAEVAKIVIEQHFIKDIKGNLRKFSQQQFRCVDCNEKFRRPPLIGKCTKCNGNVIFTISEGSIIKYLEPALNLAQHYNLPSYLRQNLELTKRRVEGIFGKEKEKQAGLVKWVA